MVALVLGVVGARGGAGASCLAAALAAAGVAEGRRAVLVDLDRAGGGIDVLLGIEEAPGLRWPALAAVRGEVTGAEVVDALPAWRDVPVLSAERDWVAWPEQEVTEGILSALVADNELVVLDLPRAGLAERAASCAAVVLLVPLDVMAVAGAMALLPAASPCPRVLLVTRGPAPGRLDAMAVTDLLPVPFAAALRWDPALAAAMEHGQGPVRGRRSALLACAGQVLEAAVRPEAPTARRMLRRAG